MPTILVVDDDEVLRSQLQRALIRRGYSVNCAEGYEEAVTVATVCKPEMAIVDLKMNGKTGIELLVELRRILPQIKVVVLTGYASITNAVDAIKLGAVNYVTKPADADQLLAAFTARPAISPTEFAPPSLAEAQWEHIQRVLAECGGNISEAAQVLRIPRRTLQRKLKKLSP